MTAFLITFLVLPLTVLTQDDPCTNYRILYDDGGRSTKCSLYYSKSHDRVIDEGWRRVQLKSTGEDLNMPTQCVSHGYCGSHSNVWLNGTYPTVEDGIVDRVGCVSMFSSCCKVEYPIQIKNCTEYMVYNLKRTFGSDERYCFGDSTICNQTTDAMSVSPSTAPKTLTTVKDDTNSPANHQSNPEDGPITTTNANERTDLGQHKTPSEHGQMGDCTTCNQTTDAMSISPSTAPETLTTVRDDTNSPANHQSNPEYGPITTTNANERTHLEQHKTPSEHGQMDETVLALTACLSVTITILIIVVLGIFCYMRKRKSGPKYNLDGM